MAEEVAAGGAGAGSGGGSGAGAGGGSSSSGLSGTSMSAADIAAPGGDVAFLNAESETPKTETTETKLPETAAETKPAEEAAPADIDLSALEDGQPEWLAKVADPAVKAEVEKLLELQKAFSDKFKDAADLDAFFKDLPGGREQVAALQTLSKEIAEIDGALESNTPEGNATVAERYLSMTPDGGVGLLRAAAQHMAKSSPEGWNQLSSELINSTLHAAGIGSDIQGVVGAIAEMRAAVAADDGEAFGRAAGKLLGSPKEAPKVDPNLQKASERENSARQDAQKAQTESWQFRSEKSGDKINNHISSETGKLLSKVLPTSISEKDRTSLRNDISTEVMSQLVADPWLASQVKQLIGWSSRSDKGPDFTNANLKADQAAFDKATELVTQYATPKLVAKAISKVVGKWSRERAASNSEARSKAKSAATKTDVGAAAAGKVNNGRRILTEEMVRGPKALSDADILNF